MNAYGIADKVSEVLIVCSLVLAVLSSASVFFAVAYVAFCTLAGFPTAGFLEIRYCLRL